jgi:hypothetical protein
MYSLPSAPWRVVTAAFLLAAGVRVAADPHEEYRQQIRPLIEKRCYECHGAERPKGDLDLAQFGELESVHGALETWQLVLERVQAFEMPPKKAGELGYNDHQKLVRWLRRLPKPEELDCDRLASDRTVSFYRGYVMSRRLNRAEYLNSLRDLFGVELPLGDLLPVDGGGGEGFDTTGNALFLSPIHIERYLMAAEKAAETVLPDRGDGLSPELSRARQRLLIAEPEASKPARVAALEVLREVTGRAFRRPVSNEELETLVTLFDRAWERGDGYVPSLRLALQAILISPHFLFLAEPEPAEGGVQRLGAVPLASKLSYFLWSSMPDERLLSLAASGELLDTNVYRAEIRRMLADPKAAALGERFALQWLDLERLGGEIRPDPAKFPEFDADLHDSMRGEVISFFNHVFSEDRSLLELIDADYTFVDERLARLYDLNGVSGSRFQKVPVDMQQRGGVLGMAAVHSLTSYPLRTSPVLRGRWILESLLGDEIKPPPPDVPALEEHGEAVAHLTLRQQLERHRIQAECAACHDKMDPLGFGLENFDVLGRWRESDKGLRIDAEGVLPSGEVFHGPEGLKQVLLERKEEILRHVARKLTGYALGRELNKFDDCVINEALKALESNGYRASVLVEVIASSAPFQQRFYPKNDS